MRPCIFIEYKILKTLKILKNSEFQKNFLSHQNTNELADYYDLLSKVHEKLGFLF